MTLLATLWRILLRSHAVCVDVSMQWMICPRIRMCAISATTMRVFTGS
jgi:hypothetical protein